MRMPRKFCWGTAALSELQRTLRQAPQRFTPERLEVAHRLTHQKALVDIISMVKHAADGEQPLLTAEERVRLALERLSEGRSFTAEQQRWLERIRQHLVENLTIDRDDFDAVPVLSHSGGWRRADRVFGGQLDSIIQDLNGAIAA